MTSLSDLFNAPSQQGSNAQTALLWLSQMRRNEWQSNLQPAAFDSFPVTHHTASKQSSSFPQSYALIPLVMAPPEIRRRLRPLNQRIPNSAGVLIDLLFDKVWEFPYVSASDIKERTISRGDHFVGDRRLDFHFNGSDRTLCRICGKHILKQKFATEHYKASIGQFKYEQAVMCAFFNLLVRMLERGLAYSEYSRS